MWRNLRFLTFWRGIREVKGPPYSLRDQTLMAAPELAAELARQQRHRDALRAVPAPPKTN